MYVGGEGGILVVFQSSDENDFLCYDYKLPILDGIKVHDAIKRSREWELFL